MRLDLTGRNVEITPALRQMLSRKLSRLDRLLSDSAVSAQIVLSRERYRHITDITLHARGDNILSGLATAGTWPESVAAAVEKITQQAQRLKEKWTTRKRRTPRVKALPAVPAGEAAALHPVAAPDVVRVRYAVRRQGLDAALARLDTATEPFVIFRHETTGQLTLVYRRKDGGLGLIEAGA